MRMRDVTTGKLPVQWLALRKGSTSGAGVFCLPDSGLVSLILQLIQVAEYLEAMVSFSEY